MRQIDNVPSLIVCTSLLIALYGCKSGGRPENQPINLSNVPFVLTTAIGAPVANAMVVVYDGRVEDGSFPYDIAESKRRSYFLTTVETDAQGMFCLDLSDPALTEVILRPGEQYRIIHFRRESDLSHTKSVDHVRVDQRIYDISRTIVTEFRHVGFADGKPSYEKIESPFESIELVAKARTMRE